MRSEMRAVVKLGKALGDAQRLRALMALRGGEVCVCVLVALLQLAPSTVSEHMKVLAEAGLVEGRKAGRWVYYRLAGRGAPAHVRAVLRAVSAALADDPTVARDEKRLKLLCAKDRRELTRCYRRRR